MESFGIAFKKSENANLKSSSKDSGKESDATNMQPELHINIWKFNAGPLDLKSKFVIDFGIKASFSFEKIKIFLPFQLDKNKPWEDLGERVCNNNDLLCAIFNEDLSSSKEANNCFYTIMNLKDGKREEFKFYILGQSNVKIEECKKPLGTWMTISIINTNLELERDAQYYVRFRIELRAYKQFAIRRTISNDLLQAAFSKLDLYDIRINEYRNLDKKVKEVYYSLGYDFIAFRRIHIFYIANTKVSIDNWNINKNDSRIIEPRLWNTYEPFKNYKQSKVFLAHHWKLGNDKEPIKQLNLFYTAKYPQIQGWTLISYLLVVIILGCIGSWLSTCNSVIPTALDLIKPYLLIGAIIYLLIWLLWSFRFNIKVWRKEK